MAHTIVVNVDVETAPKLAQHYASLLGGEEGSAFVEEANTLIQSGKPLELLTLFVEKSDILINNIEDSYAEGSFEAIVSILFTLESEDQQLSIISKAVNKIVQNKNNFEARLQILVSLFNLMVSTPIKFFILKETLKYGIDNGFTAEIRHMQDGVITWVEQSPLLTIADKREIYRTFTKSSTDPENTSFLFHKILASMTAEELATPAGLEIANAALVTVLKGKVSSYKSRNLLHQVLKKSSSKDGTFNVLNKLLTIISTCSFDEYPAWSNNQGNIAILKINGIDLAQVGKQIKLLKLSSVAAKFTQVKYEELAKTVGIPEDDIEVWIVEAINEKLIEGYMDQVKGTLMIVSSVQLSVGQEQWIEIQQKLQSWRRNVSSVLDAFKAAPN